MIYQCPEREKHHGTGDESSLRKYCPACVAEELDRLARLKARLKAESDAYWSVRIEECHEVGEARSYRKVGAGGWIEDDREIRLNPLKSEKR